MKATDPCTVEVTPLDRGGVSVKLTVPTYSGGASFTLVAERDGRAEDENWTVFLPGFPEGLPDDGPPYKIAAEEGDGHFYESYNGSVGLGAPDA